MSQTVLIAGIDVGKERLVLACPALGISLDATNDWQGHETILRLVHEHQIAIVAMEASGGYERSVAQRLRDAGVIVRRLNPLRVRRFAEARGRLAKNDRVDSETIARFAETFAPEYEPLEPDPQRDAVREHLLLRTQILGRITETVNQLEHLQDKALRRLVMAQQRMLQRTVKQIDAKVAELVAATPNLADAAARLRTVPGVGPVLAHTLLALLPELGRLTRRRIASLAGIAPFDDDTGKRTGKRHIRDGRSGIRQVLYMAALVAKRRNPVIQAFAERMKGKPPKIIIVACMRKLLVILNAMARDGASWKTT